MFQSLFYLNYSKGDMLIQAYAKKNKNILSLSRMFSLYTTRYLTLNLTKLIFFYTPKDKYSAKDMTEIPLKVKRMHCCVYSSFLFIFEKSGCRLSNQ